MKLECCIGIGELRTATLTQLDHEIKLKFAKVSRNDIIGPFQGHFTCRWCLADDRQPVRRMLVSRVTRLGNKPQPKWYHFKPGGPVVTVAQAPSPQSFATAFGIRSNTLHVPATKTWLWLMGSSIRGTCRIHLSWRITYRSRCYPESHPFARTSLTSTRIVHFPMRSLERRIIQCW